VSRRRRRVTAPAPVGDGLLGHAFYARRAGAPTVWRLLELDFGEPARPQSRVLRWLLAKGALERVTPVTLVDVLVNCWEAGPTAFMRYAEARFDAAFREQNLWPGDADVTTVKTYALHHLRLSCGGAEMRKWYATFGAESREETLVCVGWAATALNWPLVCWASARCALDAAEYYPEVIENMPTGRIGPVRAPFVREYLQKAVFDVWRRMPPSADDVNWCRRRIEALAGRCPDELREWVRAELASLP
jgi:hypothetical protein